MSFKRFIKYLIWNTCCIPKRAYSIYDNMKSPDVADASNPVEHSHASKGDTSGKPERKTRGRCHDGHATFSRPLFQNSGTSPKVQYYLIYLY